jgi:hypothetical protein
MTFHPTKKATLRMPSGPADDPDRLHLWVILTDTCQDGANLLVSISSVKDGQFHDDSCIIQPGEHRRIIKPSWVEYRRCRVELSAALVRGEAAWLYHREVPVTDELFERMCAGLLTSDFAAPRYIKYFNGIGRAF